jgi:hypothetical protein
LGVIALGATATPSLERQDFPAPELAFAELRDGEDEYARS